MNLACSRLPDDHCLRGPEFLVFTTIASVFVKRLLSSSTCSDERRSRQLHNAFCANCGSANQCRVTSWLLRSRLFLIADP